MISNKITTLKNNNRSPAIVVVGDLMLDHYIWGGCTRISPEAPVPVIEVDRESVNLGGAANVAQNLAAYGAKVSIAGICGDDVSGREMMHIFEDKNINATGVIIDSGRITTKKTRVIAGNHHITRIDHETSEAISNELGDKIFQRIKADIIDADIVLISDYNKGILTHYLTQKVIAHAKDNNKIVMIDPKGLDYSKYKGATIIKPNKKELAEAAQFKKIVNNDDLSRASKSVLDLTQAQHLIVTLSENGIALVSNQRFEHFPVKAKEVFDVTGAGDTVLATLAFFLASGFTLEDACIIANHAAAIVVKRIGSAVASLDEIIEDIIQDKL